MGKERRGDLGVEPHDEYQKHPRKRRADAEGQYVEAVQRVGEALHVGVSLANAPVLKERGAYDVAHEELREDHVNKHYYAHDSPGPQVGEIERRKFEARGTLLEQHIENA